MLIDPPWDYGALSLAGRAAPDYATMTREELSALPVAGEVCANAAVRPRGASRADVGCRQAKWHQRVDALHMAQALSRRRLTSLSSDLHLGVVERGARGIDDRPDGWNIVIFPGAFLSEQTAAKAKGHQIIRRTCSTPRGPSAMCQ
jgi:hypothetical protein